MKGQGEFLKVDKEDKEKFICIDCKKRLRVKGFFCNKCFKKGFLKRLAIFQQWQLERGFKNIDPYLIKQTHRGRLDER